ncbi:MAG: phosphatidylinositol-specific phospholipase C/glycerophosphodiester phosphodiesterase family protein [Fimbriimonadaceae bacterium]|nr:phosphatidylinositol-specific phospholipase C/glycerophosphodiester phosphodiesterase family protein [Fimbriimonadaceae bacterium]QYK59106.1 MAG: phosphatidylinositol-specific phospholipase C/glycerophosphodiester phosphodiesterase family protein [Fimbriimonadaceae bacterium]
MLAAVLALVIAQAAPLPNAHSHNDYWRPGPLEDALALGFCSIEADVFPVDGDLLVGHSKSELRPERTLRKLYLEPLARRIAENKGRVYPGGPEVVLLVDVKSGPQDSYRLLREQLEPLEPWLGGAEAGALRVVLSGARDKDAVLADDGHWIGLDGRPEDLGHGYSVPAMPLVSADWNALFRWKGEGPMPSDQQLRLKDLVDRVHEEGRRLRFWGTPHRPSLWKELRAAGVDLIGADNLGMLADFLRSP